MGLGYSRIIGLYSVINLLTYVVLLPPFNQMGGVNGTAFAMLLAAVPGILLVIYLTKQIFHLGMLQNLKKTMSIHILPIAASIGIAFVLPNSYISTGRNALLFPLTFLICYFGFMALFNWLPVGGFISRLWHIFMGRTST